MRIVALDTETTGTEFDKGDRVIEIGCVEIVNRRLSGREFHCLLNPDGREIAAGAFAVHGIGSEELEDKPLFAEKEAEFIDFVEGAGLIIHNAPFDVGFIDRELSLTPSPRSSLEAICEITDTMLMAKAMHPGGYSLDKLCKRYEIDASAREKHGALLDSRLLAQVYLAMTGGQISLSLGEESRSRQSGQARKHASPGQAPPLATRNPTEQELAAHRKMLRDIDRESKNGCLWLQVQAEQGPANG